MTQPLAAPSDQPRNPLQSYLRAAQPTDAELRAILADAAAEADRLIPKELERANYSGQVKAAQLTMIRRALHSWHSALWGDIGRTIRSGIGDVAQAAYTEAESLLLDAFRRLGVDATKYIASLRAQAERGLPNLLARSANGIPLSRQVYRTQALSEGWVDRAVNVGILLGHSAQRIAASVRDLINPEVPGGVSYAAMRLARTELNNAFKTAQEQRYADEPWVKGMQWHLSGSHPRTDECNLYATQDIHGLGAGIYPVGERPHSHPNCLCYMTAEQIDEDEWVDRFVAGEYDEYLDEELPEETMAEVVQLRPEKRVESNDAAPQIAPPVTQATKRLLRPGWRGQAAHDLVPKGLYKRGTMTPRQRKALKVYESGWFRVINGWLRGGQHIEDNTDRQTAETVRHIEEAMDGSILPENIEVWRGLHYAERVFGDRLNNDLTGFSWDDDGYGSTTTERRVMDTFNLSKLEGDAFGAERDVRMKVTVAAGTKALETSTVTKGSDANGPQAEITLQRGVTWKVVQDNGIGEDGVREIEVEVYPIGYEERRAQADGGAAGGDAGEGAERAGQPASAYTEEQLRAEIEAGNFREQRLSGGVSAETFLLTDRVTGRQYVRKRAGLKEAKREYLASVAARALGLRAPVVVLYEDEPEYAFMPFINNARSATDILYDPELVRPGSTTDPYDTVGDAVNSTQGLLLAIFDVIAMNVDRNDGNWLLDEGGNVYPIDHGYAFINADPAYVPEIPGGHSRFKDRWFGYGENLPISPNDVRKLAERLESVRDVFERSGELGWYEYMQKALDRIVKGRRVGIEDRL